MKNSTLLFLLLTFFISQNISAQTTRYVMPTPQGSANGSSWDNASDSLQKIIDLSAAGDSVFVAKGNYNTPIGGTFVMKQGVKIYGSFFGTETNLAQRTFGPTESDSSILSGQGYSRVVSNIDNGLTATALLDGFIITHGSAYLGGGIHNRQSYPTLKNLIIKGNSADATNGGGIYIEGGLTTMIDCIISGNTAVNGGGVFATADGAPSFINVTISNNTASGNGGGLGVDSYTYPYLFNTTIRNNTAVNGGGIYSNDGSSPSTVNSKIIGNTATGNGGGMYVLNDGQSGLTNVLIAGNTAVAGGGIYCNGGSGNDWFNVTITGNSAQGVYAFNTPSTLINCIVYGNNSGISSTGSSTFNISYSDIQGSVASGTNINTDPLFLAPSVNTPPFIDGDYSLQSASPCINAGNTSTFYFTDLAGRPRLISSFVDMGAYEFPIIDHDVNGITYVTQLGAGDYTGSDWANASPQVADALHAAATDAAIQQIWVAGGTYKPLYKIGDTTTEGAATTDKDKAFVLVNNVKVYGGFAGTETLLSERDLSNSANKSILSGDINDNDALDFSADLSVTTVFDNTFHVVVSSGDVGAAALNGFTIRSGIALDFPALIGGGGSVDDYLDTIIVNGNEVINFIGGGIYNFNSSPAFANIYLAKNIAYGGAGMFNYNSASLTTNSVFSGNLGFFGGGGIWNISSRGVFNNVTVSGNVVFGLGGGITNQQSPIKINNSIIYGNQFGNIENNSSDVDSMPTIAYSIIQGSNGSGGSWDTNMGIDSGNNLDADPQFISPSTGQFLDGDYTLQGGSPAIDSGTTDTTGLSLPAFDLIGRPRIVNGRIDMGAYEFMNVLPLTLVSFNGNALNNSTNALHWKTTSEVNTDHFVIQRSADAKTFGDIGTTTAIGSGTNNYNYTDDAPLPTSYYRLRIVDKNGTVAYSKIIYIAANIPIAASCNIYPNPAKDVVHITTNNSLLIGSTAVLYNANGTALQKVQLSSNTPVTVNGYASGIYFLKVQTGETFKIIVTK